MKVYIKQKVFTLRDKFDVKDENGNVVFYVKSDWFSIPQKIRIFDKADQELFLIRRKLISFLAKYTVFIKDEEVASIRQKWSVLKKVFEVDCKYGKIDLTGNIFALNFKLMLQDKEVASVNKALISFGDSYEINISEGYDPGLLTSIVIAIDNALHDESRRR
jgi:uncharacterized protein YxjI